MDLTLVDLLLELFMTAFVTISFSFLVAKLVSIAMVDDPMAGPSKIVEKEMVMEGLKFDRGLEFESTQSESRVQFVVKEVSFDDSEESCCHEEFGEKASQGFGLWPELVDVFETEEVLESTKSDGDEFCGRNEGEIMKSVINELIEFPGGEGTKSDINESNDQSMGERGEIVEEETVMEELKFDRGLEFESIQSESRVQFVVKEVSGDVNQVELEGPFDDSEESCCHDEFGEKASQVVGLWPDLVDVFESKDVLESTKSDEFCGRNEGEVIKSAINELIEFPQEKRTNPDIDESNDESMDERGEIDGELNEIAEEKNGKWSDDDDDDWEGIERSELEKAFIAAANYVAVGGNNDLLSNLQFYGLHKVAMEGPCHEAQPMALKVSARAKWNAWQRLGSLSPESAMEQYISLLSTKDPEWGQNNCSADKE